METKYCEYFLMIFHYPISWPALVIMTSKLVQCAPEGIHLWRPFGVFWWNSIISHETYIILASRSLHWFCSLPEAFHDVWFINFMCFGYWAHQKPSLCLITEDEICLGNSANGARFWILETKWRAVPVEDHQLYHSFSVLVHWSPDLIFRSWYTTHR